MIRKTSVIWRLAAAGLMLISFGLRLYQLDHIAVEKSEMTNIVWFIREGFTAVLTQNKALNNHPLNSVLGFSMSALGYESLFTLRWHSVVLGVIVVAVVYRLGRIWFGERDAFISALLMTFSGYAINISQVARGYVGLVCFTVLGVYLGWRAVQTGQKRFWLGLILVSCLNIYSHLYGAMAVGVIGLLLLVPMFTLRSGQYSFVRRFVPLVVSLILVYLISGGLYLPMLTDTLAVAGQSNKFSESDQRHLQESTYLETISQPIREVIRPFNLAKDELRLRLGDPTLRYSALDSLAVFAENQWGFYLGLLTFLLGIVFSWSKYRQQTFICLAWLLLPFGLQMVANIVLPGAYFRGRFLAFVYPPYLLLMARGWLGLADWWTARAKEHAATLFLAHSVRWLGVGLLLFINLTWLGAYYAAAANENWVEVSHHLAQNIRPNDIVYCGQRSDTACSFDLSVRLRRDVRELDEDFFTFELFEKQRGQFEQSGRVWMVLPHLMPWQVAALQEKIEPNHYGLLGDTAYDQAGWVVLDSQATLVDNLTAALRLMVDLSLNDEEKYKNYITLTKIYLARDQLDLAETAFAGAAIPLSGEAATWQQQQLAPVVERLEYARQANRGAAQLPATAVKVDLNFGGLARLLAYQLDRSTAAPGESVQVNLYWQPLARIQRDLVSYVYVTDLGAHLLSQARGVPARGQAPTTSWQPGQLVVDSYTLQLDPAAPVPLAVRIEAGLFDPNKSEFIKATDKTGQFIGPTLTKFKILSTTSPITLPVQESKANFANLISLLDYKLTSNPAGIIFYWAANAQIEKDYTVFVHLLDDKNQLAGQIDGQPFAGNYPTSWWSLGEEVADQRLLAEIKPGHYQVLVGWYDAGDGARLPLADGSGDSVVIGSINVP